jgi:hypothetical protein
MSVGYYILEGKVPVRCDDVGEFGRWFETAERIVQQDEVGNLFVSTVFLGIDHRFGAAGPPLLFETGIFIRTECEINGKKLPGLADIDMERTPTWELALEAHRRALALAREHIGD